jgi:ComF family protein
LSILHSVFLNIRTKIVQSLPAQPCILCGSFSHFGPWCQACDGDLPYLVEPHCPICALPTHNGDVCGRCLKVEPKFDRTLAVFAYAFPLNKLVQALKFGEHLMLANALADRLSEKTGPLPDAVIAMPLHPARLSERGFNQSMELARRVAGNLNIALLPHACERVRDTPPQSALPWRERRKNLRNAFTCNQNLTGQHIAVVDDVMTSGVSLNEVALALRKAGAREVSNWIIARTLPHD